MQTIKDSTRRELVRVAREAFFRKGFASVSMREISQKSKVCLSNIYNYFPGGKEDILEAVLSPLVIALNQMIEAQNIPEKYELDCYFSDDYYRNSLRWMLSLATKFREEFKLLFFSVQKTRFENYLDNWSQKSLSLGMNYLSSIGKLYPHVHTGISPFFLRFSCSWWLNMLKEIVLHEELTHEDIEQFIDEYIQFTSGGWIKLMKLNAARADISDLKSLTHSSLERITLYEHS